MMAMTALALVMHRRGSGEPWSVIACESFFALLWIVVAAVLTPVQPLASGSFRPSTQVLVRLLQCVGLAIPTLSRWIVKAAGGTGSAWEMVMLTTIGLAACALAVLSRRSRDLSISVICSGFLTLFTTAISDQSTAIYFAILWLVFCLYWMIANHWDKLDVHLAQKVSRTHSIRLSTTVCGSIIAVLVSFAMTGHGLTTHPMDWGFMPTSGGRQWSDPAARSGVGDGDALIAATKHAASFGPVDSGIFLQSDLPSLFDMFDDTLGEVVLKRQSEKAVALPNQKPIENEQQFAQSQHGEASFSISREPKKETRALADKNSIAAFHWIGPQGISLAMQRFDRFDGTTWAHGSAGSGEPTSTQTENVPSLVAQSINGKEWFCRECALHPSSLEGELRMDAIKFINLRSTRIPAASPLVGVNIQDVQRSDFFEITADDCLNMPGRSMVPAMTVVNLISRNWMGDHREFTSFAHTDTQTLDRPSLLAYPGADRLHELAIEWTADKPRGWQAIQAVIAHLRSDFEFSRQQTIDAEAPIDHFLKLRRGGDHLFATTATLMLQTLGYQARLVSGFYIDPEKYDRFARHTEVLSDDVHLWCEVRTADGLWLPLEPTPGYLEPRFDRSLWSLAGEQFWAWWPWFAASGVAFWLLWRLRTIWGEWLCLLAWWLSLPMQPTRRIKWLIRLLDYRSRLAGYRRPAGVTPSRWFQAATAGDSHELSGATARFFAAADCVFFSPHAHPVATWVDDASQLVRSLTVRRLRNATTLANHFQSPSYTNPL